MALQNNFTFYVSGGVAGEGYLQRVVLDLAGKSYRFLT